jgi:hypothetical protein
MLLIAHIRNIYFVYILYTGSPKKCIHKVNIPYNVYTSFWDTLYFNFLIFYFAPLHVLRLGRVPHLPHPCYGSA